jgi:ethanolamine utilization microcompartment shell protein EutL
MAAANAALAAAEAASLAPACTADGRRIAVLLNIAAPEDLADLDPAICDGIGLVRTEFLFEASHGLPDEDAQYAVYRRILEWAQGRPVTIRTLDAGGDKPIKGLTVDGESNPFLGLRGIRLSLARPEVFRVQLRALSRAAVHGALKVMLPMIAVPAELERAGTMLDAEFAALGAEGIACARPPLGIMIEVPAAALCAEDFDAAFYSIGSNDLTQYTMAAARDIGSVADLNDAGHPAVLALIARTVEAARKRDVEVSLCRDSLGGAGHGSAAQGGDRKGRFMTDDAGEEIREPGDSNVADYKVILRRVLDNRPSGTRLKLAAALGKNRSFVTQITNPAYLVPIPAKHVAIIFEVCHLSGAERAAFLEAYGRAHPGRLRASHREARTRTIAVTVPDLSDDKKNRALEQLVIDLAAQLARYAESVG